MDSGPPVLGLSRYVEGVQTYCVPPVSYTHLDVYKRQAKRYEILEESMKALLGNAGQPSVK